jgi:hypothetical protein
MAAMTIIGTKIGFWSVIGFADRINKRCVRKLNHHCRKQEPRHRANGHRKGAAA